MSTLYKLTNEQMKYTLFDKQLLTGVEEWFLLTNSSPQAKRFEDFAREMAFKIEI